MLSSRIVVDLKMWQLSRSFLAKILYAASLTQIKQPLYKSENCSVYKQQREAAKQSNRQQNTAQPFSCYSCFSNLMKRRVGEF
jgi:hypothetical protein